MSEVYSQSIVLDGYEVLLVLIPPNWARPVEVSAQIATDAAKGVTGVQERRPEYVVPRWSMRYRAMLDEAALQQVRSVAAFADSALVAMPFWPDVQRGENGTDYAARTVNGQCAIGWEEGFADVTAVASGAAPQGVFRGALLVGRAKFRFYGITDASAEVDIELREDSPWEMRVEPAANGVEGWQQDWQPNWATAPSQELLTLNDYTELGGNRQRLQRGESGSQRWKQVATWRIDSATAGEVLAFWAARRAGHQAFSVPGLIRPASVLPGAPHDFNAVTGRAVFGGDTRWSWVSPDLVDVRFAVEQQVEAASIDQEPQGIAYLFEFEYAGQTVRLTDWESPVVSGGSTWAPARVEHDRIRNTLKPQQEECQIKVALDDLPLAMPLLRLEMEDQLHVTISAMELPSGLPNALFRGTVASAKARLSLITLKVAALSGALARKVPRFAYTHRCNFALFGFGCQRRRQVEMTQSAWMYSGVIAYQWGAGAPRLVLTSFSAPAGKPDVPAELDGWFAGGWLETGWDTPQRQVREITWSGAHAKEGDPDRLFLAMHRVIRGDVEAIPVRFWPGCDGQYSTCAGKFGNGINFGGFPYQPAWIEQASMGAPKGK